MRTGASNPKNGFQEISTIVFLTDVDILTSCQQCEYFLPLLIIKFFSRQSREELNRKNLFSLLSRQSREELNLLEKNPNDFEQRNFLAENYRIAGKIYGQANDYQTEYKNLENEKNF